MGRNSRYGGQWWIMGVMSFQKLYNLYGLKHHIVELRRYYVKVEMSPMRDKQTNNNNYSAFDLENGVLQLLRIEHGVISYPMVLATVGID